MGRVGLLGALAAGQCAFASIEDVESGFRNPPKETRPRCYWYWMDGNISKEGITKDLEMMKQVGIGAAYIGCISGQSRTTGPVKMLTKEYWDVIEHAVREGGRLGVDIGLFNSPGWSQSGGPWVKPEQSMRHLVTTETRVQGPRHFQGTLPKPKGEFQDVAVLAFRAPAGDDSQFKGKVTKEPASVTIELPEEAVARSLTVTPTAAVNVQARLEASSDGKNFRTVSEFPVDRHRLNLGTGPRPLAPVVVSLPATKAKVFRIVLSRPADIDGVALSAAERVDRISEKALEKMFQDPQPPYGFYTWPLRPEPDDAATVVDPAKILNLERAMKPDGSLDWNVPEGDWVIVRTGMVTTGSTNNPASPEATGLEVDKMNRDHVKAHFDSYVGRLLKALPAAQRKAWKYVVADSYEVGPENWTEGFGKLFVDRYGYDPRPFLPVLTGRVVGSVDQSDRFLWDLRRLIADRVATEYVGGLRDLSHEHGLTLWLENYGHFGFPSEFLLYGGCTDQVGGEFWMNRTLGSIELRDASSAAHIYGKRPVYAEAWTGGPLFVSTPWSLKKRGDWALCEGINQFVLHVNIHQPSETKPGISAFFGTEFNRHNTWFPMARSWVDYLRRCTWLLQSGRPVADVAYFITEDTPKMTGPRTPALPPGYDYDDINADVLLHRATVKDGRLTLPDGVSYGLLVLPPSETMRPEVLEKIKALADAGLPVLGTLPSRSPSLQNYPKCDERVKELAAALKGKVRPGDDIAVALGVPPDVSGVDHAKVLFKHRSGLDGDFYFLSNQTDAPMKIQPVFRVSGKVAELWHPDTAGIERVASEPAEGGTRVPLRLDPRGSVFVAFRDKSDRKVAPPVEADLKIRKAVYRATDGAGEMDVTRELAEMIDQGRLNVMVSNDIAGKDPALRHVKELVVDYTVNGKDFSITVPQDQMLSLSGGDELTGPWDFTCESGREQIEKTSSWTESKNPAIRYFSGTGAYRKTFNRTGSPKGPVWLDLGSVESVATVTVNGHRFPALWKPPYRVDIGQALVAGANKLEIEVANVWHNRMVGEARHVAGLGPVPAKATVVPNYPPDEKLLPSGLIGPVRIVETGG